MTKDFTIENKLFSKFYDFSYNTHLPFRKLRILFLELLRPLLNTFHFYISCYTCGEYISYSLYVCHIWIHLHIRNGKVFIRSFELFGLTIPFINYYVI